MIHCKLVVALFITDGTVLWIRGIRSSFLIFLKAANLILKYGLEVPWGKIAPLWRYNWLPYQIISTDREAEIRVAGRVVATNTLLNKVRPGKIAIYHSPADGVVRLKNIKIKQIRIYGPLKSKCGNNIVFER